jgi:hypothetical protein
LRQPAERGRDHSVYFINDILWGEPMNALMVYPEWPDTYWSFKHALPFEGKRSAYPPLGLMTISSQLPGHWKKRLVDTNVKRLTDSDLRWADVVMLSGMLVHRREILDILARCRARGLRTVRSEERRVGKECKA